MADLASWRSRERGASAERGLDALGRLEMRQSPGRSIMVVAHPDDECVGAGGQLARWKPARIVYVTDGAPRNLCDVRRAGFERCEDYARQRRTERSRVLEAVGLDEECVVDLAVPDQEASFQLVSITRRIEEILRRVRPEVVFTHPYEGGHPDHDATAFCVHAAASLMNAYERPVIVEMASYHLAEGRLADGVFLPLPCPAGVPCSAGEVVLELTDVEREIKSRLFGGYTSQQATLGQFQLETERFRRAPEYDFTRPPHVGELHYERYEWGMSGTAFCQLAGEALVELELSSVVETRRAC